MPKQILTQKRLLEVLTYYPETGEFYRNLRPRSEFRNEHFYRIFVSRYAGKKSGCLEKVSGYVMIRVDGELYSAHRLAFLYMTGTMPAGQVDHINHDRSDNRWENLRSVTSRDNQMNMSLSAANTSGYTGVSKDKKMWRAHICVNGKYIHLGNFKTPYEAHMAREKANEKYGFHENHGVAL